MNKHTPGEFTLVFIDPTKSISEDEEKKFKTYGFTRRQAMIARAAPELLEALKTIMESCDAGQTALLAQLRIKARAAIEKATS